MRLAGEADGLAQLGAAPTATAVPKVATTAGRYGGGGGLGNGGSSLPAQLVNAKVGNHR
jgi:hypothetical protein